jgi:hypothetical protein
MSVADVIAKRRARPSAALRIWIALAIPLVALAAAPLLGLPEFVQGLIIEILTFSLLALSSRSCVRRSARCR